MAFHNLGRDEPACTYCKEPITFGQSMEFALPAPDGVRPAHTACNEKAYAEEEKATQEIG